MKSLSSTKKENDSVLYNARDFDSTRILKISMHAIRKHTTFLQFLKKYDYWDDFKQDVLLYYYQILNSYEKKHGTCMLNMRRIVSIIYYAVGNAVAQNIRKMKRHDDCRKSLNVCTGAIESYYDEEGDCRELVVAPVEYQNPLGTTMKSDDNIENLWDIRFIKNKSTLTRLYLEGYLLRELSKIVGMSREWVRLKLKHDIGSISNKKNRGNILRIER